MRDLNPFAEPEATTHDPDDLVNVEIDWNVSVGGFGHRQRVAGPRSAVQDIINTDNPSLIRWAVFVVTFVPTATTLIAKLPEIITAITNALSR